MYRLVLVALIGFAAQLVDGSMGMAYGVTSSTLLLLAGFSPAVASASLHLAEVGTTIASGVSHRRLGNVDGRLALTLALPGAIGGFLGAMGLGWLPGDLVKPVVSCILLVLGCSILYRFSRPRLAVVGKMPPLRRWFLVPLGFCAGICDTIGGGGWGPIVTSTLLAKSEAPPRKVVGSVNLSEAAVAVAASVGFLLGIGKEAFNLPWVIALMAGGVIAAPLAAWLVGKISKNVLGVLVGGVILLTNLRTLVKVAGLDTALALGLYAVVIAVVAIAYSRVRYTSRQSPSTDVVIDGEMVEPEQQVANLDR